MKSAILTCNAGSSNTKLALFDAETLECGKRAKVTTDAEIKTWLEAEAQEVKAVGHRVVHGGQNFHEPAIITPPVLDSLHALIPLAPLHQPAALNLIEAMQTMYPEATHVACFDTAFHHTMPELEKRLPLPRTYHDEGILRYGFHGLSYQYIASVLPEHAGEKAKGRVIVAHLGNGSSMCAMKDLKSVASTMGFSTLEGLMMGTRTGTLDAGVVLHLLQEKKMTAAQISELFYQQSGLKGVSGITSDMRSLLESERPEAKEAIALYCYLAAKQLGGLLMALGGLDALVFTGGIGEHNPPIRSNVCSYLDWLGVTLNEEANNRNDTLVSATDSTIPVYVIPTDEETVLARACREKLNDKA